VAAIAQVLDLPAADEHVADALGGLSGVVRGLDARRDGRTLEVAVELPGIAEDVELLTALAPPVVADARGRVVVPGVFVYELHGYSFGVGRWKHYTSEEEI
jgi:hypothetical protein